MFYPPFSPLPELPERQRWTETKPETPEALRERAYRLARQELPDAPVEDVICRAETIAGYLKGETA